MIRLQAAVLVASFAVALPTLARAQPASPPPTVTAGFGDGVTISTADEQFSLNIRGRIQLRTAVADAGDEEPTESEFLIRRMRLVFQGNALGKGLTYYVQLSFANLDLEPDLRVPLRDAYMTWAPTRDLQVRFGQMKVPFSRQRVTSSSALQMVDRSIVVAELNLDRDVGVQLFSKDLFGLGGRLGYAVGLFGGDGRNRLGREFGYLYTARLEAWPFGAFDDYVEADIGRLAKPRLAVGGGVGYNQNTNRPRSTIGLPYPAGSFDYTHANVDAAFKWRGLAVTGEVMARRADEDRVAVPVDGVPVTIASRSAWGAYIQAGQMLTSRLEVNGRVGRLLPRDGTDVELVGVREAGVGLSYYPRRHDLKIQGDYFRLTRDDSDGSGQLVRVQLQLFF